MTESARKPRLGIEVDSDLPRRLKVVAALHDVTIRDYVIAAVEHALENEDREGWEGLSEPSFGRDWGAEADGVYDRLSSR